MQVGDFSKYAAKNVIVPKGMIDKVRSVFPEGMLAGPEMRTLRPGKMPRSQVENLLSRVGLSGTDVGYMPMKMAPSKTMSPTREGYEASRGGLRALRGMDLLNVDPDALARFPGFPTDPARRSAVGRSIEKAFSREHAADLSLRGPGTVEDNLARLPVAQGMRAPVDLSLQYPRRDIPVREWINRTSFPVHPGSDMVGGVYDATRRRAFGLTPFRTADIPSGMHPLQEKKLWFPTSSRNLFNLQPGSSKDMGLRGRLASMLLGPSMSPRYVDDLHPGVRRQYLELLEAHPNVGDESMQALIRMLRGT